MNDKSFLDSNIVIYCYTSTEPTKKAKAIEVAEGDDVFISTQVLQETANTLRKKFGKTWPEISLVLQELTQNFRVHINRENTILDATRIAEKYGFSFYDSLVVSAALQNGCKTLYSEDMQNGQMIDGTLKIVNPF